MSRVAATYPPIFRFLKINLRTKRRFPKLANGIGFWNLDVAYHFKMILPSQIDIQIIDITGRPNLLGNVLFGLKVFISHNSWHNYSFFKSNPSGHVTLTKQDIIDNTELKWEKKILSIVPTKFELYVWEGRHVDGMIKETKGLLELYDNKEWLEQDLKRRGIADEKIPHTLMMINNQAIKDKIFYEYIKDAVNDSVKVETEKIKGIWTDSSKKAYQFIVH